ncbi:MAG: heterodisulfide reductase-related iron-sulfur binding cluster [Thermodesulfobacteriota bacterium]
MYPLTFEFWKIQQLYLKEIFFPVLIGLLISLPLLIAFFFFSLWRLHFRVWNLGKPQERMAHMGIRLKTLLLTTFTHLRFWNEKYPATMHFLIFWGIILIFLGKIVRLFSFFIELTIPPQSLFLYSSFVSEIGGLWVFVGGVLAIFRRYLLKPERLETKIDQTLVFVWGFGILISGYLIKGYRIAVAGSPPPNWFSWAPISYPISNLFLIFPNDFLNELFIWHRIFIHALPFLILFIYITLSDSPLKHLFFSPLTVLFRPLAPKGALTPISDFEEVDTYGASDLFHFTWKQLLDLEACTNCGRCQDHCPAYLSQKPLSPKKVIQDLHLLLQQKRRRLLWNPSSKTNQGPSIIEFLSEDVIWACTFCINCYEQCPVFISAHDKIIEMRRYLVLMESRYPREIREVFRNLERMGNPWGAQRQLRADWAVELGVKTLYEDPDVEFLYFLGCFKGYDDRSKKVAISMIRILKHAGVKFGILGREEVCCGDPARRIGNEYLYKKIAEKNIEILSQYRVKKILTTCPHCFNTLKNEYPQFGGTFEVIHQTEYLDQLIREKRVFPKIINPIKVTYHDSCYLSRYNGIYKEPRKILTTIPGIKLKEMERARLRSFCCGGGGGRMWMEEPPGKRINEMRVEQALALEPHVIATACPYCLTMFEDGLKAKGKEASVYVYDIAELLEKAIEEDPKNI